jgi:hypothetical protein
MSTVRDLSPAGLKGLEERLLYQFMTDIRSVGEEKSELFPEPEYFMLSWQTLALRQARAAEEIVARQGSAESFGTSLRRVLAGCSALHMSGFPFMVLWGREMWLLRAGYEDVAAGVVKTVLEDSLTDEDTAAVLRFAHDVLLAYRGDGLTAPSESAGLGPAWPILNPADAAELSDSCTGLDGEVREKVFSLWGATRALSFLMEGETRDACMQHGPYPVGDDGRQLLVFECNDLSWSIYPQLTLPEGAKWELPSNPLPYGNLAVALIVEPTAVQADRFGTLYIDGWRPESVVAASLLTRGPDEWAPGELSSLDLGDAGDLRQQSDDIQEEMFLQLASMTPNQRLGAGQTRQMKHSLIPLSAAGLSRAEIDLLIDRYNALTDAVWEQQLEDVMDAGEMPFYGKLDEFVGGRRETLFTPLRESGAQSAPEGGQPWDGK